MKRIIIFILLLLITANSQILNDFVGWNVNLGYLGKLYYVLEGSEKIKLVLLLIGVSFDDD